MCFKNAGLQIIQYVQQTQFLIHNTDVAMKQQHWRLGQVRTMDKIHVMESRALA